MNFQDWYTDRMDLYRVQAVRDGALTRHERVLLLEAPVPPLSGVRVCPGYGSDSGLRPAKGLGAVRQRGGRAGRRRAAYPPWGRAGENGGGAAGLCGGAQPLF